MATYAKLLNGLTDLGIHKMQEHLDYYIDLVNKGQKSFSDALEELIDIEKKNNQLRAENACVKTANFPFIKTLDDFEFDFQPGINRKEMLELGNLGLYRPQRKYLVCRKQRCWQNPFSYSHWNCLCQSTLLYVFYFL